MKPKTTANRCFRSNALYIISTMFLITGASDSWAVDPVKLRQQKLEELRTEDTSTQRPGKLDRAVEDIQQHGERDREVPARNRDKGEQDHQANLDNDAAEFHPPPWHTRRWMLGVRVQYLETGARVTQVFRNTPAWHFGLEQRDVIVSVDGYQIGYVNGRLYDLETELNVRPRRSGWVRLLVQNRRNGQLLNVDVKLSRFGSDFPRGRTGVPAESEIDRPDEVGQEGVGPIPNQTIPNPRDNS